MTSTDRTTRRADIRTDVVCPEAVAAALRPDNTADMETRVEEECVVTTIERESTGGLQSTVDDYVVNLAVATRLLERYQGRSGPDTETEPLTDAGTETETETETDTDTDTDTESTHDL